MILDSNIIIYAADPQYPQIRQFIAQHICSVSIVSKIEVLGYHKLNPTTKHILEQQFQILPTHELTIEIVDQAVTLRQTRKMSLGDAIIAATAIVHNLPIATANTRDFAWITGLDVINPV